MIKFITWEMEQQWFRPVEGIEIIEDPNGRWMVAVETCCDDRTGFQEFPMPVNWIIA